MSELKSVFDVMKEEKVLKSIPYQFVYFNKFEVWMQFEQRQVYTQSNKTLLLQANVDNRRKDSL